MSKTRRRISVVAGVLILVGSLALSRVIRNMKSPPPIKPEIEQPIRQVNFLTVKNKDNPVVINIQGRLSAFKKIELFSEVTGTLLQTVKPFKRGTYFKKGEILVKLDDQEPRLNLLAQRSNLLNAITQIMPDLKIDYPESFPQWENYLKNFDVESTTSAFPNPVDERERLFVASKNLLNTYYTIKSTETRIQKYTLYAPFSGVLTDALVNEGALVRTGQKLGELMNTYSFELEAPVSETDLQYINPGQKVELHSPSSNNSWTGKIARISNQIDPQTQSTLIFISVNGTDLKEGMYLEAEVVGSSLDNSFTIPVDALYENEGVYIIGEDSELDFQRIDILKTYADSVLVNGLSDGSEILIDHIASIYDGMKVKKRT